VGHSIIPLGLAHKSLRAPEIYLQIPPPSHYEVLDYKSFVKTEFANDGDLVVIDKTETTPVNGLLAFQSGPSLHYIMKVSQVGGEPRLVESDGSHKPLPDTGDECIGRVILIVRKYL